MKEIFRKASAFLSVLICFIVYFWLSNTLSDFLNYCVGGILEFSGENVSIGLTANLFVMLVLAFVSISTIFPQKDEIGNTVILYFLLMCLVNYPLCNNYHVTLSLIFLFLVLMRFLKYVKANENMYKIFVSILVLWIKLIPHLFVDGVATATDSLFAEIIPYSDLYYVSLNLIIMMLVFLVGFKIIFNKLKSHYIVGVLMILIVITNICEYKNGLNLTSDASIDSNSIYKSHGYSQKIISYIDEVTEYILQKESEGYNVYVVSADASYYMANLNRNQYKYDLVLYGSLGYGGEEELIEDTSKLENAIILKDKNVMWQEPKKFDEYIKENFRKIDDVGNLVVYMK